VFSELGRIAQKWTFMHCWMEQDFS